MVTMADVASAAGVSVTTVSHVLNATRRVNPQTEEAVRLAISATGYVHNAVARSLATARTHSVGLAVSTLINPYIAEMVAAIEDAVTAAGYFLVLVDTHDDPEHEMRVIEALRARRVDGVLLAPSGSRADIRRRLTPHRQTETPLVLIDRLQCPDFDQVGVINERPTADLVHHLAGNGHHRIAMVHGRSGLSTTTERMRGYRRGLREAGLEWDPALEVDGGSTATVARGAVGTLLELNDPPTAVISANNHMTVGVLRALTEHAVRIPQDMAVVGFDDVEWAELLPSPLTTFAQPYQEIGRVAVRLLLDRLDNRTAAPRTIRLPATFMHRASCGCGSSTPRCSATTPSGLAAGG